MKNSGETEKNIKSIFTVKFEVDRNKDPQREHIAVLNCSLNPIHKRNERAKKINNSYKDPQ